MLVWLKWNLAEFITYQTSSGRTPFNVLYGTDSNVRTMPQLH